MFGQLSAAIKWALSGKGVSQSDICFSRDVFNARLNSFFLTLSGGNRFSNNELALLAACIGEIGNNSFDHNLGRWRDVPGCLFGYETGEKDILLWIADRGRGIFSTLEKVYPDLQDDQQALHVAFEKKISGRAPEKRGNGLKFVRSVINGDQDKGLFCQSGVGKIYLGGHDFQTISSLAPLQKSNVPGVFVLIVWRLS